jgi:hypothetical protein
MAPKELYFLKENDFGMFQPKEELEYPIYFYKHQLGEVFILDEAIDVTIKDNNIARWVVTIEE